MKAGFVSLVGLPNAGKSTLLNRLVGTKLAIVSDKPQTTRTRILGVRTYPEGQVVYVDTPGIHRPTHRMNVRMLDTARDAMRDVDVVGVVLDVEPEAGRRPGAPVQDGAPRAHAGGAGAEQGRPGRQDEAAAGDRSGAAGAGVRRHRPGLGALGRQRRAARAGVPVASARGRAALSRRLPHQSARAVLRRRDGARAGAAAHPRRAAVFHGRRSSTSSRSPSARRG